MTSWNENVRGTQVLPLINSDETVLRVVAGPGTGKTFGLVRRVERLVHADGLGVRGRDVLVVAFNRVIARQLRDDLQARLGPLGLPELPVVRTIHALCLDVVGHDLRVLLPHEVEAMIYDVLQDYSDLKTKYRTYYHAAQALHDHVAKHSDHTVLWQACDRWLTRHQARLISDLPALLLDRINGGDFGEETRKHVIVDEFQDLTPAEQDLAFKLRDETGNIVVLGDPRQSIYAFRGNDREGLGKIEDLLAKHGGGTVVDVEITECQRCPPPIVAAANALMSLSGTSAMVPANTDALQLHVVTWATPSEEAAGMARHVLDNINAHRDERHLLMVTRRRFGYDLRDALLQLDPTLRIDLGFSESLLETWPVREAFLTFSLLVDPDPPTWRAWFAYQNSPPESGFQPPQRNADAYLRFLTACGDHIDEQAVRTLASGARAPGGTGGKKVWDRAKRFVLLREEIGVPGDDGTEFLNVVFDNERWNIPNSDDPETALIDLTLLREKTLAFYNEEREENPEASSAEHLKEVARRMRHQIAVREPMSTSEEVDLRVLTLWGAKGMTAEHVYVLGVCDEALPGARREEYPGTDAEYIDEQRRLFYVSITRAKRTLVLSRARQVPWGEANGMRPMSGSLKNTRVVAWCCNANRNR